MFENYWYIIGFDSEIKNGSINPIKILDKYLLLIKDDQSKISILEDRCCHRNVQLSLGTFENNRITCAYHGWQYNCQGECTAIPSLTSSIPKTAIINSFASKLKNNLIWVFIGDQSIADSVPLPEMNELDTQPFIYTQHSFDADIKFVSESLFDPYHINHVHKNSIKSFMGDINSDPIDLEITTNQNALYGTYQRKNNGTFFEKTYFGHSDFIKTDFAFIFPNISKLKIYFEKRILTIFEHMVEIEPGKVSMIQITTWENIFSGVPIFAKWFMKKISNTIVSEDINFFKSHYRLNKNKAFDEVHVKSDEASLAFRKLWQQKEEDID